MLNASYLFRRRAWGVKSSESLVLVTTLSRVLYGWRIGRDSRIAVGALTLKEKKEYATL